MTAISGLSAMGLWPAAGNAAMLCDLAEQFGER